MVSSKLFFSAAAQKGGVKFTAPAGSTVSVSDSWATAQLMNDSVVVSVTNNPAVDSRSAVLTIKNGNDSTNVPILQSGAIFKYKGAKYIVVSDNDTTLNLPYTKVGAEPTLALANESDAAVVTSIEDKDTAFAAHIGANTTGEIRTFPLILKNQEKRDTVMVTQGSIDDFVGKNYILYGCDILKMTSPTTDINELITQISGKFEKTSDTQLTLVKLIKQSAQAHKDGKLSDDDYKTFQTSTMPAIYSFYASNKLSMSALMINAKEDGMVAGLLEENGTNIAYSKTLTNLENLGFPINSFNANMFSVYEYKLQGKKLVFNAPSMMLQAIMLYHPLTTGAKPTAFAQKRAAQLKRF